MWFWLRVGFKADTGLTALITVGDAPDPDVAAALMTVPAVSCPLRAEFAPLITLMTVPGGKLPRALKERMNIE